MKNVGRILVADDLDRERKSEPAPALRVASSLAEALDSQIHLVHVYDIPELSIPSKTLSLIESPYREELTQVLEEESKAMRSTKPGLQIVPCVKKGNTLDALLEETRGHGCELAVLSTHSRKGLSRMFLGSVAEEFIRQSPIPVLALNPHVKLETDYKPKRILVALDLSNPSEKLLAIASRFAKAFRVPLSLLHVVEEWGYPIVQSASLMAGGFAMPLEKDLREKGNVSFLELEKLCKRLETQGVDAKPKVVEHATSVKSAILQEAEESQSDLIMLSHRHGSRLEHALTGSTSRGIVRAAHCPVLVV